MNILGLWDGHDSGAALVMAGRVVCAVNEERFTRRKLEIAFPAQALEACLHQGGLRPDAIDHIACATFDPAKTLTRLWPQSKERYYRVRRRLDPPSPSNHLIKSIKYWLTEKKGNGVTHWLSSRVLRAQLAGMGFSGCRFSLLDHHLCHGACAAFGAGFERAAVITLDGVGDGLSGSVGLWQEGTLRPVATLAARDSLGIFFEHVTSLLHMRELEDEGKVMALADFALPVPDEDNPLLDFFWLEGLRLRGRYHANELYRRLGAVYWRCTPEQFAAMAQRTLEKWVVELVRNALRTTRANQVALAGGVFANVKLNGLIRNLPEVAACHVFPHMGDGGLALGAALAVNPAAAHFWPDDLYLGPEYTRQELLDALEKSGLAYRQPVDLIGESATLIAAGQIVGWFQGRMEYGPRALGGRSVLALPGLPNLRDALNLRLKKRSWYQPFCPSMLDGEARRLLQDHAGAPDRYMTSIYQVRPEFRSALSGVLSRDGSCRPQMVAEDDSRFAQLLKAIQMRTGYGVLLNTSFNSHGEPLVCSPDDALRAFATMGIDCLILGDWIVAKG
ncbi:MAG: hypothetical protein HQM02_02485 [Magnetococcales bacterium]|nr:hypothetical protein [Magnetococcales bacterium]